MVSMNSAAPQIPEFQEVSEMEFLTYIEDIKQRLLKDAPEWHVNVQATSSAPPKLFYHLARFDFTKGKDQTWPITLKEFIFAYEVGGERAFFILNQHPLGGS